MKRAVLFLNLGGPEKPEDVKEFLYRLFEDPEIIRVKSNLLRRFIAWMISTTREKKSQQMYAKIGGGSPIRALTDAQSAAVEKILQSIGKDAAVRTAFTCSKPLVEDVVKELADQGVQSFLSFPLYPQYSLTTTKGAHDRARSAVARFAPQSKFVEMPSFPKDPLFVQSHADLIHEELRKFSSPDGVYLLFSAHSIPENLVTALGDPYKKEIEESVEAIIRRLNWLGRYAISWQSKLGPVKWLSPSTEDTLVSLGQSGVKKVLVIPIAFVTDHIETLYEIDQMLRETASESGIAEFRRTSGLNSQPTFMTALANLIVARSDFWAN